MDLCWVHLSLYDVEDGDIAVLNVVPPLSWSGDHDVLGLLVKKSGVGEIRSASMSVPGEVVSSHPVLLSCVRWPPEGQ